MRRYSKADSRRGQHESLKEYLARLTHLSLNEKNIGRCSEVLDMTPGGTWQNLQHIFQPSPCLVP
jgi:Na+/phosphate symporter